MSSLIVACNTGSTFKNTGSECNTSMSVPAIYFLVPTTLRLTASQLTNIEATFTALQQADAAGRAYPIGGTSLPFVEITDSNEADVYQTFANGLKKFIRPGFQNRTVSTINGGQCIYAAWSSFNAASLSYIEVDINGNVRLKKYVSTTGVITYGGLSCVLSVPSPTFSTFTTVYANNFNISVSPAELATSVIFANGQNLLNYQGLLDVTISDGGTDTTTVLHALAATTCAVNNLYANYSTALASPAAWVVMDMGLTSAMNATGTPVTLSGVTVNATLKGWNLAGSFTAAHTYKVSLASPFNLDAISVDGFETSVPALIGL